MARGFECGWRAAFRARVWTTAGVLTGTAAGRAGRGSRAATVPAAISAAAIATTRSEQRLKMRSLQLSHNIKWAKVAALADDAKGGLEPDRRPQRPLNWKQ